MKILYKCAHVTLLPHRSRRAKNINSLIYEMIDMNYGRILVDLLWKILLEFMSENIIPYLLLSITISSRY